MGAAQGLSSSRPAERTARAYAQHLLAALGLPPAQPLQLPDEHPALSWADSGLMALTGRADGPPRLLPSALAACADGALAALASLAPAGALDGLRGSRLLAERAAFTGFARNGAISAGGSCRLLRTIDGVIALNLAREDDWAALPAWLEGEVAADWASLAAVVRGRSSGELIEQARLLGLAVAASPEIMPRPWLSAEPAFPRSRDWLLGTGSMSVPSPANRPPRRGERGNRGRPRVVDLSSLWAGPLCGHLLHRLGADVVKVESLQRPDGARRGSPEFFDLLNAGKRSVALDLASVQGRAQLRTLLNAADIVIEASRPRALRQMGIDAEALVQQHPGLTWLSLTGYGREPEWEQAIAYGDDAGVAGGLSALLQAAHGERLFAGDAIADPLTGIHAALAGWASWLQGGGRLLSLPLCGVVRAVLDFDRVPDVATRTAEWQAVLDDSGQTVASPRRRALAGSAAALGADTAAVLAEWAAAC